MSDETLRAAMDEHRRTCDQGPRLCADCRMMTEPQTVSAITTARAEYAAVRQWVNRNADVCIYCADMADSLDHLVPKPWTGVQFRRYVPTVPACRDCNSRINTALVFTIAGRAEIVANALRRKHRAALAIPDRTPEELREFTGRLRYNITAKQAWRQEIRRRLTVLDAGGAHVMERAA